MLLSLVILAISPSSFQQLITYADFEDVTITSLRLVKEHELQDKPNVCGVCSLYENYFVVSTIKNNGDVAQPFVSLIEIRDNEDVTIFLEFQIGTLNPSGSSDTGISWLPVGAGNYQLRSFVISDFNRSEILSAVSVANVTIAS